MEATCGDEARSAREVDHVLAEEESRKTEKERERERERVTRSFVLTALSLINDAEFIRRGCEPAVARAARYVIKRCII